MGNFFAVGAGGFIGAVLRYGLGLAWKSFWPGAMFPGGTFAANFIGAFLIGAAYSVFTKNPAMAGQLQLFVMTGIMGGFTTFSSFSLETVNLAESGHFGLAAFYTAVSVFACFFGVWLGKVLG